ncbi:hypothetical protein ASPVEDRAFT_123290 [Aspergillus versicolor CBS 583.65]|uniref:Uncharacterized protein n=1 Tax=Aspergillus versicolor CBS 583.65 TaxID=1036611 RepID=A0A1L9PD24_ASPVE|nr:uncharacterized protein ASPVEDRAFT_123290 [Aspergillus versicolor CBS 583.65]OJI99383.1 hypothetical protein ASPVEDRAFT_123290 [Aspergillus versicolor CBS 583.65]
MPPSPSNLSQPAPSDLESDLLNHLATTHALEDLHTTLLSTLQRLGWTEKIRHLSTELLRANRCERFDDVVEAVVASAQGRSHPFLVDSETQNNSNSSNGDGDGGSGFSFENADARIPSVVVEQGVRAIKDVLREVVILEDDGEGTGSGGTGGSNISVEVGGNGTASTTGSKRQGDKSVNGDTSPTKKGDKKTKQGKQAK